MAPEHREQGETRHQIVHLLRRNGHMTAAELSESLGVGAVGIRQHLALLERDGLVAISGVRRGIGRPSHLYTLTPSAEALFPKRYEMLAMDALAALADECGPGAVDRLFARRRQQLHTQLAPLIESKPLAAQVAALAEILTEHGYMCEWRALPTGEYLLTQHNCPLDCAARQHPQSCAHELKLYEDLLHAAVVREETIADGGCCCRYRITLRD
jgi:predicted ArsR family transcriptional regulator